MRLLLFILTFITTFAGRVTDEQGVPVPYATVYPEMAPEWGTATNNDGRFSFEANLPRDSRIIVSYIGYEKKVVLAETLWPTNDSVVPTIVLHEQPIALQETVVAAKKSKQKNKRKQMASLLYAVYVKLEEQFPDEASHYQVVSDVRMNGSAEGQMDGRAATWGMEQMIANIVVLPEEARKGRDSVQFQGRYCKRFFSAERRAKADSLLAGDLLERMQQATKVPKGTPTAKLRQAANAIDSGVVVHEALFAMGNMRYDFEQTMTDTRHWTVSNESEGETVLTHTQTVSKYLGCYKLIFQRHYIVDSETFEVHRFSEHAEVKVFIPFGYKLSADQLQLLNLVNMNESRIEKFRLRRLRGTIDLNTIYQRKDGHLYTQEKNMIVDAHIIGAKDKELPLLLKATQRVTDVQTKGVKPLTKQQITKRVPREIVEIY